MRLKASRNRQPVSLENKNEAQASFFSDCVSVGGDSERYFKKAIKHNVTRGNKFERQYIMDEACAYASVLLDLPNKVFASRSTQFFLGLPVRAGIGTPEGRWPETL